MTHTTHNFNSIDLEATPLSRMPAPPEGTKGLQLNPKAKPTTTKMKQIIGQVLSEKLDNASYQSDRAAMLTKEISDSVKMKLKECNFPRFKYVVQVVIGEQRGEGVRMGCRCFWDSETDCYASETFSNDSLFCVATAYSIYLY